MKTEIEEINQIAEGEQTPGEMTTKFDQYWPLVKACLKLAKVFCGPKADRKIDEIILWGDGLI